MLRRPAAGWTAAFGDDFDDLLLSLWAITAEQDERSVSDAVGRTDQMLTRADRVTERFATEIGAVYLKERR